MDSSSTVEESIKNNILSLLNNCIEKLNTNEENNIDQVVTIIKYLIENVEEHRDFAWSCSILLLLVQASDILCYHNFMSSFNGRPRIEIPKENLEYLLSLNFRVPHIAGMYNVSTKTIFRRMKENNLSVMT